MEYVIITIGLIALIFWIAGFIKILKSNNINLIKIFLIILAFSLPPFTIFYLFKGIFIRQIKDAPEKLANHAIRTGEIASKTASEVAKFLLKK